MLLKDKNIVVTGAGRGIGKAVAIACAKEGANLAITSRTIDELKEEIRTLTRLEASAKGVRDSEVDRKWEELSQILQDNPEMFDIDGNRRKIIIFSEHRSVYFNHQCIPFCLVN